MIDELFLRHPRSVGEGYVEHQAAALSFSGQLLLAGLACLVHGLVPALFTTTASSTVDRLHERLVVKRAASRGERPTAEARAT